MSMINNAERRMNIALFSGILETEFSHSVCEGAMIAAKQLDANLFIFPGGVYEMHSKEEVNTMFEMHYNAPYTCVQSKEFDVVVVEYGTITSRVDSERKKDILAQFGHVPVILIAGSEDGCTSFMIDNKSGITASVDHLVEEHNCTKVGFVSGPVTNQDALERLIGYKEAMLSHNLDGSDDWIVYGDFSEYCSEVTKELILRHPDIEAIIYANDQMAAAGYEAMKSMNLQPGKDILATGFDDNSYAVMLEPHLTTVKVDVKEIAYRAVMYAPKAIAGNVETVYSGTKLITRNSCSCSSRRIDQNIMRDLLSVDSDDLVKTLIEDLKQIFFDSTVDYDQSNIINEEFEHYFEYYLNLVDEDGILHRNLDEFNAEYSRFLMLYMKGYINLDGIFFINRIMYDYLSKKLKNPEDKLFLLEQVSVMSRDLFGQVTRRQVSKGHKKKIFEGIIANLSSDLLQQSGKEKAHYENVMRKLQQVGFSSSYIQIFDEPITIIDGQKLEMPEQIYTRGYCDYDKNDDSLCTYFSGRTSFNEIFTPGFMPKGRRYDMLVLSLYSRGVQYGLFMAETDLDSFGFAGDIATQISISVEVLNVLNEQIDIKKELERNLAKAVATNRELDEMSRLDPLTGVSNRRGFFQMTKEFLDNPDNYGKKAIVLFADMDNLKTINDEFGHDDGDFALKSIAGFLTGSFRKSDVIGRMGGDEFAAFAIIEKEKSDEVIKDRIRQIINDFNAGSNKPYYVDMSIGTQEFIISKRTDLNEMLNIADEKLYEEKKNKVKNVLKEQGDNMQYFLP